jgi:hypothetical protein
VTISKARGRCWWIRNHRPAAPPPSKGGTTASAPAGFACRRFCRRASAALPTAAAVYVATAALLARRSLHGLLWVALEAVLVCWSLRSGGAAPHQALGIGGGLVVASAWNLTLLTGTVYPLVGLWAAAGLRWACYRS